MNILASQHTFEFEALIILLVLFSLKMFTIFFAVEPDHRKPRRVLQWYRD